MFDDLRPELNAYGAKHMITPNFDRLAKKSVLFENAFAQISVCCPSRVSLLTGLRPDSTGVYNFEKSIGAHTTLTDVIGSHGYNTAGYGKIFHAETRSNWNVQQFDADWYKYQAAEIKRMNSSTFPDNITPEEQFRDHMFTSRTIARLKQFAMKMDHTQATDSGTASSYKKPFMLGVGYKSPHLCMHIPFKYYDMYRDRVPLWQIQATTERLQYPRFSPSIGFSPSINGRFKYMNDEGRSKFNRSVLLPLGARAPFPAEAYVEAMWGYSAAVSFVDAQLGRLLDAFDELRLWDDIVIVLTSDHGMHNGEKGIWNKWTLFDESTQVPLLVYHPKSPHKGMRYKHAVELIDVFPTVLDLLGLPLVRKDGSLCPSPSSRPPAPDSMYDKECTLDGQSLAPVVLPTAKKTQWRKYGGNHVQFPELMLRENGLSTGNNIGRGVKRSATSLDTLRATVAGWSSNRKKKTTLQYVPISLPKKYALSQKWICAPYGTVVNTLGVGSRGVGIGNYGRQWLDPVWENCLIHGRSRSQQRVSLMGYSLRTDKFRYTMYIPYDESNCSVSIDVMSVKSQELYIHNTSSLRYMDETVNVLQSMRVSFSAVTSAIRRGIFEILANPAFFKYTCGSQSG